MNLHFTHILRDIVYVVKHNRNKHTEIHSRC